MKTHGLYKHPLYRIWNGMKSRCYIPTSTPYKHYGAKGIVVCDEWKEDFIAFYNWGMAQGWEKGLSIDRRDPKGNYTPENCRLIPLKDQGKNRSHLKRYTLNGETKILTDWCKVYNLNPARISRRLDLGWPIEKALMTPIKKKILITPLKP